MSAEVIETPVIVDTVKPEENNPPAVLIEINTTNNTEKSENVAKNKPNKTGKNRKNNNNNNNNNKRLNNAQQNKNNKNWKINKFNKRQYDKKEIESIHFDKNNRKYGPMSKFKNNNNNRGGGQRWIPMIPIIPGTISKFFLPEKLPRKELIIPPTKFLLGGNISDPLNLNSLQDEAMNRSMNAATPKSSPMTTPPKIEIICPPNIHDPLHLLDPVDTFEYNKQLISPMKRKSKHRNRKRKRISKKSNVSPDLKEDCDSSKNDSIKTNESMVSNSSIDIQMPGTSSASCSTTIGTITTATTSTVVTPIEPASRRSVDQEKVVRDLRLELSDCGASTAPLQIGQRKRRISESHLNNKNKVRRMDSMDKIVSPVIPQPGGWKRPPRVLPSGSRNRTRTTSTTTSATEELTPTDSKKEIDLNVSGEKSESESCGEKIITAEGMETDEKHENLTKIKLPADSKYQYGNYKQYYGRRNLNENMDVRLKVFMKHPYLFKQKDVLDIGCNAGHITIEVAKELAAKSVTGIDIDKTLIGE